MTKPEAKCPHEFRCDLGWIVLHITVVLISTNVTIFPISIMRKTFAISGVGGLGNAANSTMQRPHNSKEIPATWNRVVREEL